MGCGTAGFNLSREILRSVIMALSKKLTGIWRWRWRWKSVGERERSEGGKGHVDREWRELRERDRESAMFYMTRLRTELAHTDT